MLQSLSAKNFILIDQLDIALSKGFYVITGETGAGKSIILDAILFCLGQKFDVDVVRPGAEFCAVTLELEVIDDIKIFLQDSGIECTNEIIIKRQQFVGGCKKFFINDQLVTQKIIEYLANNVIEIHGQNSHSGLLDISSHLKIIDSYGSLDELRDQVAELFKLWQRYKTELEDIKKERHFIDREIEYLEFVVQEIRDLNIEPGEEAILAEKRNILQKQEKNVQVIQDMLLTITSPDILSQILSLQKIIYRQIKDDSFKEILSNLDQSLLCLEEVKSTLEQKLYNLEPGNINDIEERLFAIRAIARKHNITVEELPQHFISMQNQLDSLMNKVHLESNLEKHINDTKAKYDLIASELSDKRHKIAQMLEQKVSNELEPLKMGNALLKISFKIKDQPSSTGNDDVQFLVSTNPGMPLSPIEKIASGGELSRFMLAFKVVLFDKFAKPTIIFDEVDTGIGGVVADAVGERLKLLGKVVQVISITHQPQVAGKAHHHICVSKTQMNNMTFTNATILSMDERIEEIARMISGQELTEISRKAANALIDID